MTTSLAPAPHTPTSSESQTLSGCGVLTSEEQTQEQPQPQTLQELQESDEYYSQPTELLHIISPKITDAMVRTQLPLCSRILGFFADADEYRVQAAELVLKFNRAYRSGKYANGGDKKLYIRTAAQYLKSLESENAYLLNEYASHDFKNCETCKGAGVWDYKAWVLELHKEEQRKAERKIKDERAAAELAAREAERQRIAALCPECRKNAPGKHLAFRTGAGWVKVCDPCYDHKYEYQQSQLDMGKDIGRVTPLEPRPEYLEAKRKAEAAAAIAKKMEDAECDVPICTLCGQVTHARSCPTRQPKIQEATA